MLRLALFFFVIAVIAGLFGFGGASYLAMQGAELFLIIFVVLAILGLVFGRRYLRL